MAEKISKGERDELRRIVRGDFKALGSEVDLRRAELLAEIERRVADRFMAHEGIIAETEAAIAGIVANAEGEIVAALRKCAEACSGYTVAADKLRAPHVYFAREKRDEMRRTMVADLDARVAQARARMMRQENDLLKRLSQDALDSPAAHEFLASIPKVAELVPDTRMAELEAQFDIGEG